MVDFLILGIVSLLVFVLGYCLGFNARRKQYEEMLVVHEKTRDRLRIQTIELKRLEAYASGLKGCQ